MATRSKETPLKKAERRMRDPGRAIQAALLAPEVGGMELVDPSWDEEPTPSYWAHGWGRRGAIPREADLRYRIALDEAIQIEDEARRLALDPYFQLAVFPALWQMGAVPFGEYPEVGSLPGWGEEEGWEAFYNENTLAFRPDELAMIVGATASGLSVQDAADIIYVTAYEAHFPRSILVRQIAEAIYQGPYGRLYLVNLTKQQVADYVAKHHSALPEASMRGALYGIGAMFGNELVAVALANTPSGAVQAPGCPQDGVLDLSRVASGRPGLTTVNRKGKTVPVNASSALTARIIDLLPGSGRRGVVGCLLVTYSLLSEMGTTYVSLSAKGLRPTRRTKKVGKLSGSRAGADPDVNLALEQKVRWEAGPAAAPPDWSLVPERLRRGAAVAFDAYERRQR